MLAGERETGERYVTERARVELPRLVADKKDILAEGTDLARRRKIDKRGRDFCVIVDKKPDNIDPA